MIPTPLAQHTAYWPVTVYGVKASSLSMAANQRGGAGCQGSLLQGAKDSVAEMEGKTPAQAGKAASIA